MGTHPVGEPLYLCMVVPQFPAQALLRLRPELVRSPVAVLAGDAPFEQVRSMNSSAARLGVMEDMTLAELDCFDGLCILRRSTAEERSARIALLEAAGAFTPRFQIQLLTPSTFAMVLDMTGTARIFGPPRQMAASIARTLTGLGFFVQVAASANFHAAVCMAPSVAKTPVIIPAGKEAEYLRKLPLSSLRLTPKQAETLSLWGLQTVAELAALPEVDLVVRLGQDGKRLRLLARGEHPHLMVPEEPVFTLEEFLALDSPVDLLDSLLFVFGPMLDQLLLRAQNRAYALASITMKLSLDGGGEHQRTIKPALPVAQKEIFLKLLHFDLQAHPPSAGVLSVFLHAEPGDRSKVQLGLFAPQLPEPSRLDVTLARIAALVGEGRVGRARLQDTHHPDSFTMERFVVPFAASGRPAQVNPGTKRATALRRCRPPVQVSVQPDGQRLASFLLHGRCYQVQQAYGPWRKSGDWWTASVWSREEWDVLVTSDATGTMLCLLSHDLLQQQWHLEALYD